MSKQQKLAVRRIMAQYGLIYQTAHALNELQQRYGYDSLLGPPSNPAVLLSWARAWAHLGFRPTYRDEEVGPYLLDESGQLQISSRAPYWVKWFGQSEEEQEERYQGFVQLRGFTAAFEDSPMVMVSWDGGRTQTRRDSQNDSQLIKDVCADVRHRFGSVSTEEEEARQQLVSHPQLVWRPHLPMAAEYQPYGDEWQLVGKPAPELAVGHLQAWRPARVVNKASWLDLVELLPDWRLESDPASTHGGLMLRSKQPGFHAMLRTKFYSYDMLEMLAPGLTVVVDKQKDETGTLVESREFAAGTDLAPLAQAIQTFMEESLPQ